MKIRSEGALADAEAANQFPQILLEAISSGGYVADQVFLLKDLKQQKSELHCYYAANKNLKPRALIPSFCIDKNLN